jgi:hypothetical protein
MRKIIEFDSETYDALVLLARDSMSSLQELADEAFRDVLKKHGRPTSLKDALRRSLKAPTKRPPAKKADRRAAATRH